VIKAVIIMRRSGRAGMPSEEVLGRAAKRAREIDAAEKDEDGPAPK
jgi:hypothetical protein